MLQQLRSQLPGVRLDRLDERLVPPMALAIELRLTSANRSLRTDTGEVAAATLLSVLRDVHGDELAALSWLIGPVTPSAGGQGLDNRSNHVDPRSGATAAGPRGPGGAQGQVRRATARRDWLDRCGGDRPSPPAPGGNTAAGSAPAGAPTGGGPGGSTGRPVTAVRRLARLQPPALGWPCRLNAAELAVVLGWPIGNPYLRGVRYQGGRQLPPSPGTSSRASTHTGR